MQPDCSLCIGVEDAIPVGFPPVWVHFDAKYRVDNLLELMGSPEAAVIETAATVTSSVQGEAKRDDLLKMHAYRDAIRRSAGAYVLYPGDEVESFTEYHEILPGLGAFALRPTESGVPDGVGSLRDFISAVLLHVASQVTQHERGRYWERTAFDLRTRTEVTVPAARFLSKPPADTLVLLGYVKGGSHLQWIKNTQLYNLRADGRTGSVGVESRELAAELVILYGPTVLDAELWRVAGGPRLLTRDDLLQRGYPSPGGHLYMCLPITRLDLGDWQHRLTAGLIAQVGRRVSPSTAMGAPIVTTWLELSGSIGA